MRTARAAFLEFEMPYALLRASRRLLRRLRPNSGLTRLSFNRFTNSLFRRSSGAWSATTSDGIRMEVDPDDYVPEVSASPARPVATAAPLRARLVARLTRVYPFLSGCGKIGNHPAVAALAGPISGATWLEASGGRIYAPLDDTIGRAIFFTGDYDRKITWLVSRMATAGDTVVDVGANFGLVSVVLARRVGGSGTVHAFEPNSFVVGFLQRTLEANGFNQVRLHAKAVGAAPARMTLTVPRGVTGGGSLTTGVADRTHGFDEYEVEVTSIDEMFSGGGPIALMKVDVEGFESEVFAGARTMLRDMKILSVLFEEHQPSYDDRLPETLRFFEDLPFDVFGVPRCMTRMRLLPLMKARSLRIHTRDYVALARTKATDEIRRHLGVA